VRRFLDNSKIFLVGGAVRDELMGREPHDFDFVVVNATPEQMLRAGFQHVGADFPVFLDKNGDEFALARTERKVGSGHKGFETDHSPDVTLKEDLVRRDFTMNAIARSWDDKIIDPFNGRADIADGIIRHVSPAFREDPLRVLRAARFAARFNFSVAPETMVFMMDMVADGDLDSLVKERVWKECQHAIMEPHPHRFIEVLDEAGALEPLFGADVASVLLDSICNLRSLGSRDASKVVRWMAIFQDWNEDVVHDFAVAAKMPSILRNQCVFAVAMSKAFRTDGREELLDALVGVMKRFRLDSSHNIDRLCIQWEYMMWMTYSEDAAHIANDVVSAVVQAGLVGFDNLSEDQQASLKGKEISDAIFVERRKLLDKLIM